MKKISVFTGMILFFAGIMTAQENAKMWIGGTVSVWQQELYGVKNSGITLLPEFGYNIAGNWALGGRLGISSTKDNSDNKSKGTYLVPFARYSIFNAGNFTFFGQGELPISFYSGDAIDSYSTIGMLIRPGIKYDFCESWGFNLMLPSVLSFVSGDDHSSFEVGVNNGYVQNHLDNTCIGFVYKF
ncbi:hypothetical protein ACT3CD_10905 [Geofilum sp. OHC36d9]|uniref:hypothetical protein n=1 Tax=Geofilum sp. OHC36d9 TaxID=3458413 RepID=UPI004033DA64